LRCVGAIALAAMLASCSGDSGPPLFPLGPGWVWTYRVTTALENNTDSRESLTLRTLAHEVLDGQRAFRRRSDTGADYWLRVDESGIYRVASKSDVDPGPLRDPAPRYVLKMPISVGTQWQASSTAYVLQRRSDFPREIRHTHPNVPMTYSIDATGEAVATPAGKFDGCVRVRGHGVVHIYADAVVGWRDMPLTTLEWYCPGVGLVKLERDEPARSTYLLGGHVTMELLRWQRN
jgi:hypothetical protein